MASVAASAAAAVPVAPGIVGTVKDSTGRPLANAQVVVSVVNRALQTDANGAFAVRGLAPGVYHVDVSLIGFAPQHAVVTVPESGADVVLNLVLRSSPLRLTGVLVSAAPTGTDALGVTQAAVELSGKGLALNLGSSVAQTLANEPGMAMRYNGPMANVPVIRGLTGDRILVLQDGERTGDLSSASADHALSIDPFSADRIEVIRGPASLLYGNNALGGVVNVISNDIPTDVPTRPSFFLGGQGESVGAGRRVVPRHLVPVRGPVSHGRRGDPPRRAPHAGGHVRHCQHRRGAHPHGARGRYRAALRGRRDRTRRCCGDQLPPQHADRQRDGPHAGEAPDGDDRPARLLP
ncbi:MAG: carboxypeptidase regulatory-like domain-containing protein [Gemmatimonadetes bacterium]|nr:carboxypeptidase regulatory-like domain-containing protein [Gemmatimonadota bacterium]